MLLRYILVPAVITAFWLPSKGLAEAALSTDPVTFTRASTSRAGSQSNAPEAFSSTNIGLTAKTPLIQIASLKPLRLDATYNQQVSLRDCLEYAMSNNLAIKISHESYVYQRYTFLANLGLFIPTNTMSWNLVRQSVGPGLNTSLAFSRVFSETVRYPVFQGGYVFYNALAQNYRQKGWHKALDATKNDTLLTIYKNYTNLLLNQALLQIHTNAVEVSEARLELNEKQLKAGKGTRYAIMQSKAQLESDRQALLDQQVELRAAAINLSYSLNGPLAVNLIPVETSVAEVSLFDERSTVDDLLKQAYEKRPELRQYEYFRLAANRTIQVAAAPLLPNASFFTGYTHSSTSVSGPGARASAGAGVFGGLFNTNQSGFVASQTLAGAGVPAVMNVYGARALARQAQHQANQELISIERDLRIHYLSALAARQKIQQSTQELRAAQEALRMAGLRLKAGAGNNLESIEAQSDYVSAKIKQAKAIIRSNQAQAQILHDIGAISIDALIGDHTSLIPLS